MQERFGIILIVMNKRFLGISYFTLKGGGKLNVEKGM